MTTLRVNLDTTRYVRITIASQLPSSMTLESHGDTIRVVVSDTQPSLSNIVFHELGATNRVMSLPKINGPMWALSMSARSALTVTQERLILDSDLEVARGNIFGQSSFDKFGRNPDVSPSTDPEDVWNGGGLYTGFPTDGVGRTLTVVSTSANDAAGGTGARSVRISNLLDVNYNIVPDVTVALNGLTPVSLGAGLYYRSNRMEVAEAGSLGGNQGEITLQSSTNVFGVMPVALNQSAICGYTVPLGYTLYINSVEIQMSRAGGALGSASVSFRARPFGETFQARYAPVITDASNYVNHSMYLEYEARTDIVARVDSVSNNNTSVSADLSGVLINNLI
jgi:hypothetical protein